MINWINVLFNVIPLYGIINYERQSNTRRYRYTYVKARMYLERCVG